MKNIIFKEKTSQESKKVKSSDLAYLEQLEFNPELKKSWLNFFVVNFRVVVLMILLLSGWGIYSYIKLPRESNPEVKIPIAVITAVYPGASPTDVEELVTKKIETNISGVSGIDKITSQSTNSFSSVTVEFNASEDLDNSVRKLRDKLSSIRNDIPDDADDPQVVEISFDDKSAGDSDYFFSRESCIHCDISRIPNGCYTHKTFTLKSCPVHVIKITCPRVWIFIKNVLKI